MRSTKLPRVSRGRAKHVIALLVVPDAVAVEVALVQQVFGRRMSSIAAITGEPDSPYEVVLCGEQPRHTLPSGADLGQAGQAYCPVAAPSRRSSMHESTWSDQHRKTHIRRSGSRSKSTIRSAWAQSDLVEQVRPQLDGGQRAAVLLEHGQHRLADPLHRPPPVRSRGHEKVTRVPPRHIVAAPA